MVQWAYSKITQFFANTKMLLRPSLLSTTVFSDMPIISQYSMCCVNLREWYEEDSIMVRDEGQVLAGLLMGLNATDYNMTLSAEEFDKSVSVGRGGKGRSVGERGECGERIWPNCV